MMKLKFPVLIDKDFLFEPGEKEGMLDKLAIKLNKTRDELDLLFLELQQF